MTQPRCNDNDQPSSVLPRQVDTAPLGQPKCGTFKQADDDHVRGTIHRGHRSKCCTRTEGQSGILNRYCMYHVVFVP